MSTPPPPQPNPYGQPPQQPPNPYAHQPHPGFPQQQPHPGFPQQQPYPGFPQWQPPKKKSRAGLVLGIVGGVLGIVLIGVGALAYVGIRYDKSFPKAEYRLELTKTLLDGKYELAKDLSRDKGSEIADHADGDWDAKDVTGVVAQYTRGGNQSDGVLIVSGMYGRFKNTDKARNSMMKGGSEADNATLVVEPRDFHPAGTDVTITCQVLTHGSGITKVTMPMCAWTDGNTGASVAEITPRIAAQNPQDVDLAAAAATAAKVRSELRKPVD
ncbi:hypothetical protein [Streptomyces beihaiensis]|uniref:Uncharacterized protein n=1 Tax=Streptomyces beihaiensis TaxID=2984495 RepID=A0ABT3U3D4_9ACTN|nr:hypothetical protein [Streptomyces beihaiensis]MCX3063830.1 hypothetical protein [Streptomyces beihaiensis]